MHSENGKSARGLFHRYGQMTLMRKANVRESTYPNDPRGRGCWFNWSIPGCEGGPPAECQLSLPEGFIINA